MGKGVPLAVMSTAVYHGLAPGDELTIKGSPGFNGHYAIEAVGVCVFSVRRLRWYEWTWREVKRFLKRVTLRFKSWAPYY